MCVRACAWSSWVVRSIQCSMCVSSLVWLCVYVLDTMHHVCMCLHSRFGLCVYTIQYAMCVCSLVRFCVLDTVAEVLHVHMYV